MNLKTTLVLLVLAAAGVVLYLYGLTLPPALTPGTPAPTAAAGTSLAILENELTPQKLTKLEVQQGGRRLVLERDAAGEWSLPGKWPTRKAEVDGLINLVTGLHSRFAPLPLTDPAKYGLDRPAVTIKVVADGKEHALFLSENDDKSSAGRFARPTYLRIDELNEVVRLSPGIITALDKPIDYYQQRRLFPSERIVKDTTTGEKADRLIADALSVVGPKETGNYALKRVGEEWELSEPVRDRPDPDKLKTILGTVPDIWAEQFVSGPAKPLSEYGLAPPEETLTVARPGGSVTLLIGKVSPTVRERKVTRPTPPGMPAGLPPLTETVKEEYRYAKLANNDQVFEIKADRLKELFVAAKELRDARLARFKTEDVRKVEIKYAGQEVVLAKEKERWQLEKPIKADAEANKVTEVLDKLSGLQARDADIVDKADPKSYGFDDPAKVGTVKLTVEQEKGEGEKKTKTTRTVSFVIGKHDTDKKKLSVKVDGWDRVNLVEDSVVGLAKRPALAYRGRRILDFVTSDVDSIRVERSGETVGLKNAKDGWKLDAPVRADADTVKAGNLASTLSNLEATEYVNDAPKPADLESFGLAKGALKATVTFTADSKKTPQVLLVGKARPDKPGEFYARLESGPSVFSLKKEVHDALDTASLAYRPQQLWQVLSDDVTALKVQRAGQEEYRLTKKDGAWAIAGPFDATAVTTQVEPMLTELTGPKAERYEAHDGKGKLKEYGLDAPALKVSVTAGGKERVLLVGKTTGKEVPGRYAKLGDSDAVFVVADKLASAVDKSALDLLDRRLLTLNEKAIERVQGQGTAAWALQRQGEAWQVVQSPAPAPFAADEATVGNLLRAWSDLHASRYAAYGPKAGPAAYGLSAPSATIIVTVQPPEKDGKKLPVVTHTLALGKPVEGTSGERYARLDNGPGIVVLSAAAVADLTPTYLDFVNRTLVKADAGAVTALVRQAGGQALDVRKKDGSWMVTKPQEAKADDPTLDRLVDQLTSLRAKKVAAYPAKDLKPFGLDAPAATLTLEGPKPVTLKVGGPVAGASGDSPDRYVQVQGSDVVGIVGGALARQLLAEPIRFRDKTIARFDDADRVLLERGGRKATFAKVDGTWKLVEPLEAEAEQADLDDFLNAVAKLRADEVVADKPADLKPFGLDKPEAKWSFQLGTTPKLTLLVGNRDKAGRAHARVEGKDLVFVLDAKLTERVAGEYRKRNVWTASPDPSQVERLRFVRPTGEFILEKAEGAWRLVGKPEAKVNQATVTDLLAALDKLKVDHYVADKGAELKLYGLAPPELVLEITTPTGRKELQIGRTEGDSKRRYARVPEKDRSDVFVLSEADTAKIVREAAGFLEGSDGRVKP